MYHLYIMNNNIEKIKTQQREIIQESEKKEIDKAELAAKSGLGAGVLLTDTHNERGLSVDHGGGGAESSEFRVQASEFRSPEH